MPWRAAGPSTAGRDRGVDDAVRPVARGPDGRAAAPAPVDVDGVLDDVPGREVWPVAGRAEAARTDPVREGEGRPPDDPGAGGR